MAKKEKELSLNDVLTKISNVFKTDMYVLDYCHCMGGIESEEKTVGENLLMLSPNTIEIFKESFPDHSNIFFKDIKKSKQDLQEFIETKIRENEMNEVSKRRNILLNFIKKCDKWENFHFSEEQINVLYKECGTLELFGDDKDKSTILISKSIFPMITEKNINDVCYHVLDDKNDGMGNLMLSYDTDYFQIYSLIRFVII